jgi:radical SAM-linked protein
VARTPDGPPPPPPVQRLRLRYAKRGRLRFSSHRDFQRALERALRRAGVPMAYSAGFNPHPKISYANAAPTGAASEAEYVEIAVAERCDPDRVRAALDESLPDGLDVVDVVEVRTGALAERLEASEWAIRFPGLGDDELARAAAAFLAAPSVEVQRLTKNGVRTFDARLAVAALVPGEGGAAARQTEGAEGRCAILRAVVRHGDPDHGIPSVRPDDVINGLRLVAGLAPQVAPEVTRLAQGPLDPEAMRLGDPLAADREAAPTA